MNRSWLKRNLTGKEKLRKIWPGHFLIMKCSQRKIVKGKFYSCNHVVLPQPQGHLTPGSFYTRVILPQGHLTPGSSCPRVILAIIILPQGHFSDRVNLPHGHVAQLSFCPKVILPYKVILPCAESHGTTTNYHYYQSGHMRHCNCCTRMLVYQLLPRTALPSRSWQVSNPWKGNKFIQ